MSKLPRLKIKWYSAGDEEAETCNFEQAKERVFSHGINVLVLVDGRTISSYEELVQLAAQPQHKDKDEIEIILYATAIAGG